MYIYVSRDIALNTRIGVYQPCAPDVISGLKDCMLDKFLQLWEPMLKFVGE
jgi:hypothetical protein